MVDDDMPVGHAQFVARLSFLNRTRACPRTRTRAPNTKKCLGFEWPPFLRDEKLRIGATFNLLQMVDSSTVSTCKCYYTPSSPSSCPVVQNSI